MGDHRQQQQQRWIPIASPYDLDAERDACIDLSLRRVVYSSLAGAFAGLLLFRTPVTRWASVALGAGVGIGSAYTECSYILDNSAERLLCSSQVGVNRARGCGRTIPIQTWVLKIYNETCDICCHSCNIQDVDLRIKTCPVLENLGDAPVFDFHILQEGIGSLCHRLPSNSCIAVGT